MIIIDPETRQPIPCMDHVGDIVYQRAHADSAVTDQVVPVIGPWVDFTGSGGPQTNTQMIAGAENKLFGTDADIIYGDKVNELDVTGNRKATTRRRPLKMYAEIKNGKAKLEKPVYRL